MMYVHCMLIVDNKDNHIHVHMPFRLYIFTYAIIVQVKIAFVFKKKKSQSAPKGTKQLNFCSEIEQNH